MARKPKEKYKTRPNGTKETARRYKDFGLKHYTGQKHFYGKTDDEVDRKIKEFEDFCNEPPKAKSMSEIIDEWWEEKEKLISPNSISSYKAKKEEIRDRFGDMPVDEITASSAIAWLKWVANRGFSQRSVSDRKSVLKNVLDYALAQNYIQINPCANLPIVKGASKIKRKPASEEDVALLEEHKTDSLIARMYYFMEYTGCRIGEAVVLQEKDIDREHHKASIYKDIAYADNTPQIKDKPKSDAGIRDVDLYDNVLAILPSYEDEETYIFFPNGLPHKSDLQKKQLKFRKSIGITSTAHQLRHTYAGIMHSAELDVKDTQARMGHANASVTQDIYTEIERQHNEKTRNKANDYIMNKRLGVNPQKCPNCGGRHLKAEDGFIFKFCPECGVSLE